MKQKLLKTWLMIVCLLAGVGSAWADSLTLTFSDVASALSWENSVAYTKVTLNNFAFEVSGGGNNGKYYTSDKTWRFYSGGGLTITPAEGCTITSVSSDASQDFTIANGAASTSFSASVRLKSITINYTTSGGTTPTPQPTKYDVTIAENILNGTVTASASSAEKDATITLTATPATGYKFSAWSVKDASNNTITVSEDNKFTMPASNVTVSATFVEKAAPVYANLASLVADGKPTEDGEEVTVTLKDEVIKSIFVTSKGYRNGVFIDVNGQEIEIFCQNVPEEWVKGGTVSGTLTCTWKLYDTTWELCPQNWNELSYSAPEGDPEEPATGEGVTHTFSSFAQANNVTIEADGYTITLHKNTGSTAPQWNGNSSEARVYAKGSVVVTSTKNIVKVVYDYKENTGGSNKVVPTIDGVAGATNSGEWDATSKTWTGNDTEVTLTTSGSAGNLGFKSITVYFEEEEETPTYTLSTLTLKAKNNDGYYATFSSDKVTFFPEDYIVSAVSVENGKLVTFENEEAFDDDIVEIEGEEVIGYYVPANTGVLVYSLDATVNCYEVSGVTPSNDVEAVNMLVPTTADGQFMAEADGNKYYKLSYGDNVKKEKLGFWWGAADGSGMFNVKAGGAVLCVPAEVAGVKGFSLNADETAIEDLLSVKEADKTIYNVMGVRMQKMQKGVNIVNGRKVIR